MRAAFLMVFGVFSALSAIDVTNNHNSGPGSLRRALLDSMPGDTIDIDSGLGTIVIGSSIDAETALPVLMGVTINGNGNTISGDNKYPVLFALSGSNEINDLTLINGRGVGGDGGAGAGGGGGALGAGGGLFICPSASVALSNVFFDGCRVAGGNGGNGNGSNSYLGGGGGGGGYNSNGGGTTVGDFEGGSGGGGGGVFNSNGGVGESSGGGGGGTHLSDGGAVTGDSAGGGGGGGGVFKSSGGVGGTNSSGGGGGYDNAAGGDGVIGANSSSGGAGGGGDNDDGESPTGTEASGVGGAGGSGGGGKGGDSDGVVGQNGANGSALGGGGGGGSVGTVPGGGTIAGNGGDGNIGGGGGGGFVFNSGVSGKGGDSKAQGGGGGGGYNGTLVDAPSGNGGNGGNAVFGGGGGGARHTHLDTITPGGNGGSSQLLGGGGGGGAGGVIASIGGQGGLGGGGGGAGARYSNPGLGGFGGGTGGAIGQRGGGGSAFGGAVFIAESASLTMQNGGETGGHAGPIGIPGGEKAGDAFYLMTNAVATFDVTGSETVTIPNSIAGGGAMIKTGTGALVLSANNQPFTGTTTINQGNLILTGILEGQVTTTASGNLSGTGSVNGNLQNDGKVSPGNSLGVLTVNGSYTQCTNGTLFTNVENATATNWGKLVVNGPTTIRGTLILNFLANEQITDGDQIVVLESNATINGTFSSFTTINGPTDVSANLLYEGDRVVVVFTVILFPPKDLQVKQIKNVFASQTEFVNRLTWKPSPTPGVTDYIIYRNGKKIAKVPADGCLAYDDHNQPKCVPVTYEVRSADKRGNRGPAATVTVSVKGCRNTVSKGCSCR